MAALATVATVATGVAAVVGAGASVYSGYVANQNAQAEAARDEAQGKAEFAAAQRDALERRVEGLQVLSDQQAAAAASGGGAGTDAPTVVRLMTETADRTEQGAEASLYAGEQSRNTYFTSAASARATGGNNFVGSLLSGLGDLVGGAGATANVANKLGLFSTASDPSSGSASTRWGWSSLPATG